MIFFLSKFHLTEREGGGERERDLLPFLGNKESQKEVHSFLWKTATIEREASIMFLHKADLTVLVTSVTRQVAVLSFFHFFFFSFLVSVFFVFVFNSIVPLGFPPWKFELLSPGKASYDGVALPNLRCMPGVYVFP